MNKKSVITISILFLSLLFGSNINSDEIPDLDIIIGQMLIIGFRGCDLSGNETIVKDIKNRNLGGIILFDYDSFLKQKNRNIKNPEQLKSLISKLKSYSSIPLLIAIDQEGGKICRLKEEYDFPKTYSAQYLGTLNNTETIISEASKISETLKDMGINLNLAPVVDLNTNPDNPAIGRLERSFSDDPEITSSCAVSYIMGLHENNILSCIKHFPGHGSSYNDSHKGLTDITVTWDQIELIPYKNIIDSGNCDMVMTAHVFNKNLDDKYPATLSKKTITGILRENLGFNGVIITDDMQMKAIKKRYTLKKTLYLSIDAGVDIILFANNIVYNPWIMKKSVKIIKQLIKKKKISKDRLIESYKRIMNLKIKLIE